MDCWDAKDGFLVATELLRTPSTIIAVTKWALHRQAHRSTHMTEWLFGNWVLMDSGPLSNMGLRDSDPWHI